MRIQSAREVKAPMLYGKGLLKIFVSPNSNDRIKRAFVFLGYQKSLDRIENSDALNKFTTTLDSLLSDGTLNISK